MREFADARSRGPTALRRDSGITDRVAGSRTGRSVRAAFAVGTLVARISGAAITEQLTTGMGNDTEACWSPDGTSIVFQTDREGTADILRLHIESGILTPLATGPEHACFPEYSPDGRTVFYALGRIEKTAVQAAESGATEGYHICAIDADGGKPEQLTHGRERDYAPTPTPDGKALFFASSRGSEQTGAGIHRLVLDNSAPQAVIAGTGQSVGAVEPDVSPDGRLLAYAETLGTRSNWRIWLADMADPACRLPLTPLDGVFYSPRWSPDGRRLACTGFRTDDPGWGIYVIDVPTGSLLRIDTGSANARSPDWSPDGHWIAYESNRTGRYKIYRVEVPELIFPPAAHRLTWSAEPILRIQPDKSTGDHLANQINPEQTIALPSSISLTPDGALRFGKGALRIDAFREFAFGTDPFYVTATLKVDRHTDKLRIVAVGDYPSHRMGWQIFINDKNLLYFNARTPGGLFVGAHTDTPLEAGRKITVTGLRGPEGTVELFVDGVAQRSAGSGATMGYEVPNQVRLGTQFNGTTPFDGLVYRFEVGRGLPEVKTRRTLDLTEFYP
jgi:Tol biopolymer transport system component